MKTLLEDISLWGEFEELTQKIKKDLKALSASELYEIVLNRLESDYDNQGLFGKLNNSKLISI